MNLVSSIPLFGFAVVGCLPFAVFRRGRFNPRWLATAAPFLLGGCALAAGAVGWVEPWFAVHPLIAILATTSAVALICATASSHTQAPALWHQENDRPSGLVTTGAYKLVRHPFYSAFLLLFLTAWLALPCIWTFAAFVYALIALTVTARSEEQVLRRKFGAAYSSYVLQTGRFLPSLRTIVSLGNTGAA